MTLSFVMKCLQLFTARYDTGKIVRKFRLVTAMLHGDTRRLATLDLYELLDTEAEASFDRLVILAALVCETPISLVSLLDADRQWFKARVGLEATETPIEHAFCLHAVQQDDIFVVNDASQDARFRDNPLVTSSPNIRFYAGAPLRMANGENVGTLCVIDRLPADLDDTQREALSTIRDSVVGLMELKRSAAELERISSLLPLCAWCKSVKQEDDQWLSLQDYVERHPDVTHGICPTCSDAQLEVLQ